MRDIYKAISDYKTRWENNEEGLFYLTDAAQIRELSRTRDGKDDIYNAIENALKAGFTIGYRKAQRDAKKAKAATE